MTIAYHPANSEIILRDGNLQELGEISKFITLEATVTLNDVGSWIITMRPEDFHGLDFDMRCGINVYRDKVLIFDGPVTDVKNTYVAGEPLVTIVGATDNQYLKDAVCFPVVSGPISSGGHVYFSDMADVNQTLTVNSAFKGYDIRSGPAQLVMQQLVDYNIGPHACRYSITLPAAKAAATASSGAGTTLDFKSHSPLMGVKDVGNITPSTGSRPAPTTPDSQDGDYNDILETLKNAGLSDDDAARLANTQANRDTTSGNTTVGRTLNISRSLSNLVIGPGGGIGLPVTSNARGDNLLTQLQNLAAAGCINFQITLHGGPYSGSDGSWLQFDTFVGRDLTNTVELSVESGTLKEYEYIVSRPKGNVVIAAGPNVQENQMFWFGADPDSITQYGMVEDWASGASANSQDTADQINTEMDTNVNTALLNEAYTTSITLTLQETDQLRFKRDFDLGDKVRVWVGDIPVDEVVRQFYYVLSSSGTASGGSLVTTFKPRQTSKAVQQIRQNTEAINRLMLQR